MRYLIASSSRQRTLATISGSKLVQQPLRLVLTILFSSAFAATILSVTYDITVKDSDDPYITTAEIALDGFAEAGIPGSFVVDYLPFLKYIPSWMPGAGFKRKAAHWARANEEMCEKPFLHVKDQLVSWTIPNIPYQS